MSAKELGATFVGLLDLAAEEVGGEVLSCTDDFFAEKENLLKPGRGVFLPDDGEEFWTIPARERLRALFTSFTEELGLRLESAGCWLDATECYRAGLDVDDLNETLYRGLMRAFRALDRAADAMAAFRRMRQMLSVVLGIQPSPESEALARLIADERRIS